MNDQLGFLFRTGFDTGKLRLGFEYNLVPKADINTPNGELIANVNDSYFGVTIGFHNGDGKN